MNRFQDIFDAQKALFATGVTRTYEWRVEQLDRMARMIRENERRLQEAMAKDFKTASQEYIFETQASAGEAEVQKSQLKEWMKPVEAPVPRFLAETGQTPAKAVENLRLEGARALMEDTNHTIDVVAQQTGFGDRNRMRRAFLRTYGQSPQVIRRQSRGYASIRKASLAEA